MEPNSRPRRKPSHKWKRDAAYILGIAALIPLFAALAWFIILFAQAGWDIQVLLLKLEEIVHDNSAHIELIRSLEVLGSAGLIVFGRWIGHKRHEARDKAYIAEYEMLEQENADLRDTIATKDALLSEFQIHHPQ